MIIELGISSCVTYGLLKQKNKLSLLEMMIISFLSSAVLTYTFRFFLDWFLTT